MLLILRWFQGYVRFAVLGARPGEALAVAAKSGAVLFGVAERDGLLTAACSVSDYRRLTRALRRQNRRRRPRKGAVNFAPVQEPAKAENSDVPAAPAQPAEVTEWWEELLRADDTSSPKDKVRKPGRIRQWLERLLSAAPPKPPKWVVGQPLFRRRRRVRGIQQAMSACRVRAEVRSKCALSTRVLDRRGPRFTVHRYRKRPGILVGLVLAAALILILQGFIWDVTIEGNERLPDGVYMDTIAELGLKPGVRKCDVDTFQVVHRTALAHPEIAWMAVNLVGNRAYVEIRERVEAPEPLSKDVPCNLVASEDAQIVSVHAFGGQKAVEPDVYVAKGALLVSGVFVDFKGGSHLVHAWGEVMARVTYTIAVEVPMETTVYEPNGREVGHTIRLLGGWTLPLSAAPGGVWASTEEVTPLSLFGVRLPGDLITTTWVRLRATDAVFTEEDARAAAVQMLQKRTDLLVGEGTLEAERQIGYAQDGIYRLEARLTVLRDIAQEQEIYVSSSPEAVPSDGEEAPQPAE